MVEINNTTTHKINIKGYEKTFNNILDVLNLYNKYVSVGIVDEKYIKQMNRNYRGINKPTDVLSFLWGDELGLGEIIFCYDIICKQAKENGNSIKYEMTLMFIHGILHLLGYEDEKSDEEYIKMEDKQKEIIEKLDTY